MAIAEALSLGVPVIATDVGGIRDMITDGQAGFVVPAGDESALSRAIVDLALDQDQKRFRTNAWLTSRRYSAESVARETLDCYRQIINSTT